MKTKSLALAPLAGAALLALAGTAFSQEPAWVAGAREVAGALPPKLVATLADEIAKSGADGAIGVCRDKAPALAKAASEASGWQIRRVSLKNRNPKAVPDAWERAVLEDFDRRAAAGESPATLEKSEVVTDDGKQVRRYMRALPTQELCLNCHGPVDKMKPAVVEKLKALYPDDKGTGYAVGQIRGAMTIRKAM